MRSLLAFLRILLAVVLFVLALAVVVPIHIAAVDPLVLVATEWGHLWSVVALGILCSGIGDARGAASFVLASAALLLLGSPLIRAVVLTEGPGLETIASVYRVDVDAPAEPAEREIFAPYTLSLYVADSDKDQPSPVVLAIASRDGVSSSIETYTPWLRSLNEAGFHVVTADWEGDKAQPLTRLPVDAMRRWVSQHATEHQLHRSRIALLGLDAAGTLALLEDDVFLAGRVAWSPYADLATLWSVATSGVHSAETRWLEALTGGPLGPETQGQYKRLSPVQHLQTTSRPTLILCPARGTLKTHTQCSALEPAPGLSRPSMQWVSLPWATPDGLSQPHGPTSAISRDAMANFLKRSFAVHRPPQETQ